jgi:hypothetical protein
MGHKKDGILFQKGFKRGPDSEISNIWKLCRIFTFFSILMQFLAHLAKGNVSFCHHLASVVR